MATSRQQKTSSSDRALIKLSEVSPNQQPLDGDGIKINSQISPAAASGHLPRIRVRAPEMLEISHIHANLQDAHIPIILVFCQVAAPVQHEIWTILSRKGHDQVLQNLQRIVLTGISKCPGLTCRPT